MPGSKAQEGTLRVLAVEDDVDLRAFYRTLLVEEGYEVRVAGDGAEALAMIDASLDSSGGTRRANEWAPDLILLDLMLPVMDGYQFLHRLRASPRGARIPVLVLSAALPPGRDTLAGAQAVLRKPFEFDRLLRAIDMYGHQKH